MDFDLNKFYNERDNIMKQEDEDLNDYRKRMTESKSHFSQTGFDTSFAAFQEESPATAAVNTSEGDDTLSVSLGRQKNPTRELKFPQASKGLSPR